MKLSQSVRDTVILRGWDRYVKEGAAQGVSNIVGLSDDLTTEHTETTKKTPW